MANSLRRVLVVSLSVLLAFPPAFAGPGPRARSAARAVAAPDASGRAGQSEPVSLHSYLLKPYLELFELAPNLHFSAAEIARERESLNGGKDSCVNRFKDHGKQYGKQIEAAQKELKAKSKTISASERAGLHCRIQNLELLQSESQVLAGNAIPTAYDNLRAKLDLIQNWPAQYLQAKQQIASGAYQERRWGDVKDIGFREIAKDQQDDIKRGQQAIEELRRNGLLPPDLPNKAVQDYVDSVAQRVAKSSDLKIPLHVAVIQSREVNAFALPGGYLFIERGLLEAADNESELAGVIAHEIAHDSARHANKLMKRATIASIFYQAAQIAAVVLTGGVAGIGTYYALQYGFFGLGLVLNLNLLGVSRDYELEADQLGIQYAWNAGYDPSGFIRFFDKMATRMGYVNSVSWFRTHPAFYQRMVDSQREIMFLPPKPNPVVQTSAFEQMKRELAPLVKAAEKESADQPSLMISKAEGCAPPTKIEYKPGQPIEQICSTPLRSPIQETKSQPLQPR